MKIRPVQPKTNCASPVGLSSTGKGIKCPSKATMKIDDKAICDKHAEELMTADCGLPTKIVRGGPCLNS
jgi:hypothetical protein